MKLLCHADNSRLLDLYASYYGGFLCVCWSPDGKYVLTGGQDDLVSIWSIAESTIVARCQGHQSWVTAVCFDPWRCDDRNYRFGSVGEDCRLLLWDFSVGMLHRPKAVSIISSQLLTRRLSFYNSLQLGREVAYPHAFRTRYRKWKRRTRRAASFLMMARVSIRLSTQSSQEQSQQCCPLYW